MDLPHVKTLQDQRKVEPFLQDLAFWESAIEEICQQESIAFNQIKAGLESSSAVFILDNKYVVKIFTPYLHKTFPVETELLEALSLIPDIPSPALQAVGLLEGRTEWPYLIMECIPGQQILKVANQIEHSNLMEIATQVGQIVHAFHHMDTETILKIERIHGSLAANLHPFRQSQQKALESIIEMKELPPEQRELPVLVLDEMEQLYQHGLSKYLDGPPVLAHNDLTEDHLILIEKNGKWHISGLIDYADACIGLREFDWHDLWFCLWARNAEAMRAFLDAYDSNLEIDTEFRRKCMFFATRHTPIQQRIHNALANADFPNIHSLEEFLDLQWSPQLINALDR